MTDTPGWHIWIDRGGTFTDIVAIGPDGQPVTRKLLSENPEQYADAAVEGIRRVMSVGQGDPLPEDRIAAIHMGTTVATNALLERKGARTVLVTTRGLADQLEIGYQHRPRLFVRQVVRPAPLYSRVIEIAGRVDATGTELETLDEAAAAVALQAALDDGFESCAIVLMHAWRHPAHEKVIAALARRIGFTQVSASHEVSPLLKFVSRGHTTLADAYLSPVLARYVGQVSGPLGDTIAGERLRFMRSSGSLATAAHFSGKDALLSGPAGGVIGMAETARQAGFDKVIGFDMGGTSTDVSRFDGAYNRTFETEVGFMRIRSPMLAVHTVAAGGGSILFYEGARMRVGPESAGANPGPASYRRGGPLTVTDANIMVGRIQPDHFPRVFGPCADEPLDEAVVRQEFATLARTLGKSPEETADGFLDIAVANMAEAIKKISIAEGADASLYALQCFGGAGAQLACRVAAALGIRTIMIHPYAGILSAFGMGLAQVEARREQAVEAILSAERCTALARDIEALATSCRNEVASQGKFDRIDVVATAHLRYQGTDTALAVPFGTRAELEERFRIAHETRFGFSDSTRALVLESVAIEARGSTTPAAVRPRFANRAGRDLAPLRTVSLFVNARAVPAPLYDRAGLDRGDRIPGPAIIVEPNSTIVVDPGWEAEYRDDGNLVLQATASATTSRDDAARPDPVRLEIFNALFMSIAEQMGTTLEKTASSVNIKERLDFSCAIFDQQGDLVANAPHMPVHLGSMGESVRAILDRHGSAIADGDAFAVNAPYAGGTHLPDITVVMPVMLEAGAQPSFFVAARGHHADVGGITPGSMPPNSASVEEEGVLFNGERIMAGGHFDEEAVRTMLTAPRLPARNPAQNIADLKAQLAACMTGAHELQGLCREKGRDPVIAYMGFVQDNAEEQIRQAIAGLSDGRFRHEMDDGAVIEVAITIDRRARGATVDFTGTSGQRPNNFNAPRAVTTAAVLYVFRCLIDCDIPLNAGCLRPLGIIAPEGSMLNPR
ncbi:MAG: hydantoinase B/oxoprolinase family protein, partial [Alphaproteobacteria bacterium]|nr:hydantoinase B/oxoprolinase family protein [Alphaproteobacteria bacterium]